MNANGLYKNSKGLTGKVFITIFRNGDESEAIFDELLYEQRFVIERTNAWVDTFKALLVRFETNKTLESTTFTSFLYNFITSTLNNFIHKICSFLRIVQF